MSLWKWLGMDGSGGKPEFDSLDSLESALEGVERGRRRYVACFAYILTRSARADQQVTEAETREMARRVAEHTGVSLEQAARAIALAGAQARRSGGTDDFVITREFDTLATHAQKLGLVDALFAVSSVDQSIVTVEDNEIRRIANELRIEHREYIAVRAKHLAHLEVLRKKPVDS
jgi:uncharacterized tellurite resistance protein B-like protein